MNQVVASEGRGCEILAEAESKQCDNFLSGMGMAERWMIPQEDRDATERERGSQVE